MARTKRYISAALALRLDARLALRNLTRQRGRTLLTASVIAAGVAGLILSGGFVDNALRTLREVTIHGQLGHLQVYRTGYYQEGRRKPFEYLIDDVSEPTSKLRELSEVVNVMSRLLFAGVLNNGRRDYAIFGEGVEPSKEEKLGTHVDIVEGRSLKDADRYGVLVGTGVANGIGLHAGDTVTLVVNTRDGALNALEFQVVGVFRTFSKEYDARAVRIALPAAQELFDLKAINAIVVELSRTEDTAVIADKLRSVLDATKFEVRTWSQLADFYQQSADLFRRQFLILQSIILLSVLISVANSVNMTIFERTGEFGTLMAIGTRRRSIFRMLLVENAMLGALGSLFGLMLAIVVAWLINHAKIELPPPPTSDTGYFAGIDLSVATVFACSLIGLIATPISALIPALRMTRVPVVDALRAN